MRGLGSAMCSLAKQNIDLHMFVYCEGKLIKLLKDLIDWLFIVLRPSQEFFS
jgi:hypothetical protein